MSCSVVAVPAVIAINLFHLISVAVASSAVTGALTAAQTVENNEQYIDTSNINYNELQPVNVCNITEKEFQTAFVGKDILIKTLEEHGVIDIEEDYNGKISGTIGTFTLNFERNSESEPYTLKVSCNESDNAEAKLNDLNAEYALNVQEDAYLNLIENLKENNMEIENEVVEEDNTIVLTINLE